MRLLLPLVFALVAVAAPLRAQAPAADAATPQQPDSSTNSANPVKVPAFPRGRITGTVFCGDTRTPARGATVLLSTPPGKPGSNNVQSIQKTTHVSVDGTYSFEHIPAGEYTVLAFLQGYLSVLDDLPADLTDPATQNDFLAILSSHGLTTLAPDGIATANIVLERGGALSGRVLYADGATASQLIVTAEKSSAGDPKIPFQLNAMALMKAMMTQSSYSTDDLGRFRISGLKPGTYRVVVTQSSSGEGEMGGDGMGMIAGMIGDPRGLHFYSGDTFHKKAAKTFELRAGDEITGIDFRLPVDGLHAVRGLLTAPDGRTVNTAQLTLTDTADPSFVFSTTPDQEGAFSFNSVPPGTYTLSSKNAVITPPPPPPDTAPQPGAYNGTPTAAFADATAPVIVKESDLSGVSITLTEIPVSKPPDPVSTVPRHRRLAAARTSRCPRNGATRRYRVRPAPSLWAAP